MLLGYYVERQVVRFYVLSQSQLIIAAAAAAIAVLAIIGLAIFAWRVFIENVERTTLDDSELTCRHCKSKAVHPSFRTGVFDQIFWMFSCTPYRCSVCSWRFYLYRPQSGSDTAPQAH